MNAQQAMFYLLDTAQEEAQLVLLAKMVPLVLPVILGQPVQLVLLVQPVRLVKPA